MMHALPSLLIMSHTNDGAQREPAQMIIAACALQIGGDGLGDGIIRWAALHAVCSTYHPAM